jgi:putative component of membrane protein insertase Oxa1/YidC/SpoIIIJ protein YidD
LLKYGVIRGGHKAIARVMRCHPYSGKSGFDPLL